MKFKSTLVLITALLCANAAQAMPITGSISWEGDFSRSGDAFTFSGVEINEATHDFAAAGFSSNDPLAMAGFNISAFVPVVLWSANGLTFTLNAINQVMEFGPITGVIGGATVTGNGFDATPYTFVFSTSLRNFSATAVPEPGLGLLLLTGVGALMLRRRQQTHTVAARAAA